ncbi:hypothetical protein PCANB_000677 [Pneumocystis canis]|nr:hypothetical protein PCANB_000677 [Pneumocystis canis]
MALCILFEHIKEKICVFTVDHKLRIESRQESEEVHNIVLKMGFYHKILSLTWPDSQLSTKSTETIIRDLRYTLLTRACLDHNINVLFLGHHSDDQAETILMRLIERSGPEGLAGMQKISQNPMVGKVMYAERVLLCRPFLDIPKTVLKNPTNKIAHISKRNAIRKLFQNPDNLPSALKPSYMLNIAEIMTKKKIEIIENAKMLLSKIKVVFIETTGSLEVTCGEDIFKEKISTLSKLIAHFVSLVSPLPKQRKSVIQRITVDLFTKKLGETKRYTVGGVLIDIIYYSQALFIQLKRQPYEKCIEKYSNVSIQLPNSLNLQDTWTLWDGRWWIRIFSKNDIIKQFKIRPLAEFDIKLLYSMISSANISHKENLLNSLKMIKGNVKFTIPLVESENNIIGLPTLGIIFDHTVVIETKFKVDISIQLNRIT